MIKNIVYSTQFKSHALKGEYKGFYDYHIKPDWILIYNISENNLVLTCLRTGTHSDLF